MRIIGGKYRAKWFKAPKGRRTHPMAERVRAALFSTLGELSGLIVYDAYGGSGAVGFEAASRGASFVQITEKDRRAYKTLVENLELLEINEVKISRANCTSWAANNEDTKFDVIIADPPYDNFDRLALAKLTRVLKPGGTFVVSYPKHEQTPEIEGLKLVDDKKYGDAQLAYYKS